MTTKIGTTQAGLATLKSLGIPEPMPEYRPYSELLDLGNGERRGVGYPTVLWRWSILSQTQRDALRTYCTGVSATVYIETRTNDNSNEFRQYETIMLWPGAEDRDAGRALGFDLEFRIIEDVTT